MFPNSSASCNTVSRLRASFSAGFLVVTRVTFWIIGFLVFLLERLRVFEVSDNKS